MRPYRSPNDGRQQGAALLVAVILLLLAGLISILALNVGVFEQRSSGNDLRAKVVKQVAEAGLTQGFEYLMRANSTMLDDTTKWELCAAGDEKFPCGAVPAAQRASMYRLKANVGGYADAGSNKLEAALTQYMLPNSTVLPAMGAFDVAYGVAPVLCRVPKPVSATTVSCSTGMTNLSDRRVVTFVSVAQVRGDSGRTTLTQTVARSSLLAQPGGVPSVVASGTVVPPGNGDVVAMPDIGGPGLDVAIWSRLDVEPASGSFATCTRQDFLESGQVSLNDPSWQSTRTCNGCGCGMAKKTGDPEGWDILDKDSNVGTNKDVKPEEFPCDLFAYAFGDSASGWQDNDGDNFCEVRRAKVPFTAPSGVTVQLYPDEAFLYTYAAKISPTPANAWLVRPDQLFSGSLGSTDSGLIWCQVDCLPNGGSVGSVANPVGVVADAGTNTPYHAVLYGLLFFRSTGDGPLSATTGGNASMKFNSQSAVYGSVLIQGQVTTGSGGGLIFGDASILTALGNNPKMARFDTMRGGWTDRYSY
ncbi:hypothetical protein [Lysobacter fragariae]